VHLQNIYEPSADQGGCANPAQDFRLTWLRQLAADRRLAGYAPRVGIAISDIVDPTTLTAQPKQAAIAAQLGITDRTVRAALAALTERGHLEVTKRYGGPNAYRLLIKGGRNG
jgi:DNA-binding transcriptional ArsR family regulator